MNLKELLEKQKQLDTVILDRAGIKEYPFKNIKLALLVEISELANEWQGFKHWKKNISMDREKLVEEWADCFHFALSLENELKQTSEYILENIDTVIEILDRDTELNRDVLEAFEMTYKYVTNEENVLSTIIALGRCLGISLNEMEQAYLRKHKENYRRQENGY